MTGETWPARLIAAALSSRRRGPRLEAWELLITRWDVLTDDEQSMIDALVDGHAPARVWAALERAASSPAAAARRAATAYLAAGAWRTAPELLISALADPEEAVARAAEDGIRGIAAPGEDGAIDPLAAAMLAAAAETHEVHQSRAVVAATLVAGRRAAPEAWAAYEATDEGRTAMVRAMRSQTDDVVRERAWEELATPWLAMACVDRLRGACATAEHAMVLERGHLALGPARRSAAEKLGVREKRMFLAGLLPTNAAVMRKLAPAAWVGMARCGGLLGVEPGRRETLARACLGHPSAEVRFAAWRQAPVRSTIDAAFDRDERIARSAALAAAEDDETARVFAALGRSEHALVRAIAGEEMCRRGLVWEERGLAMAGLRARYAEDAVGVEHEWRALWEGAEDAARAGLARIAARIGLLARVGGVVADGAAWDAESGTDASRLAATVARLLGGTDRGVGERGLASADARVCSNAVEAVRGALADRVVELRTHEHHRVRATAVRRLMGEGRIEGGEAREHAAAMLGDGREGHRLAGAWLAERVARPGEGRSGLAAAMERVMEREPSAAVRRRITACVERWVAEIEAGGVGGVGGGEGRAAEVSAA